MRIGELASRAGVTTRTVRYYEDLGLLPAASRGAGGHRNYDEQAVARLQKIFWLKRMGLTLDEIAEVIPLYFDAHTSARGRRRMLALLERRLAETEARVDGLLTLRDELRGAVERMRPAAGQPAGRA